MKHIAALWIIPAFALAADLQVVAGGGSLKAGAPALQVQFVEPFAVAFDREGNYYVCEFKGQRVVRVDKNGNTKLAAGTGEMSYSGDGGPAGRAALHDPHGIVLSRQQQLYIADTHNNRVRKVDLKTGIISTVAGNGTAGFSGDGGPALQASFHGIFGLDINPAGDRLYLADLSNRRVRMVDLKKGTVSTIAGNGSAAVPVDGALAADSPLVDPRAVAAGRKGEVYILERGGNALRMVDTEGRIHTLIAPGQLSLDLKGPKHLTVDLSGDVIIADAENNLIRKYSPATRTTVTVAGTGVQGSLIIPTDPLRSQLSRPHGVTVHPSGDLYISDSYNHRILRWRP